jgi:hypothetical protein
VRNARADERTRSRLPSIAIVLALIAAGGGLRLATDEPPFPDAVADAQASAPGQSPVLQIAAPERNVAQAPPRSSMDVGPTSNPSRSKSDLRAAIEREIDAAGLKDTVSVKDRERIAAALAEVEMAARRADRRVRGAERDVAPSRAAVAERERPVERAPRP